MFPLKPPNFIVLHKAFIDSGGASGETYKSLLEKTAPHLAIIVKQDLVCKLQRNQ